MGALEVLFDLQLNALLFFFNLNDGEDEMVKTVGLYFNSPDTSIRKFHSKQSE